METPENVVLLSVEQRAEIKRLALAATPGPWVAVAPFPALPDQYGRKWPAYGVEQSGEVYGHGASAIYYAGTLGKGTPADGHYIAAVSPDVALGTLALVESLEAENAALLARLSTLEADRDALKPCTCGFLAQTVGDGCWKCNPECFEDDAPATTTGEGKSDG